MIKIKEPTNGNSGAVTEHIVAADLLSKGYEVFRSCGPNSNADIVARNANEVLFVESRAYSIRSDGTISFIIKESDRCDFYAGVVNGVVVYKNAKDQQESFYNKRKLANRGGPNKRPRKA